MTSPKTPEMPYDLHCALIKLRTELSCETLLFRIVFNVKWSLPVVYTVPFMASMLDLTLGALEVGTLLSVCLYGLITLQVYVYFQGDYHDHLIIRTLVPALWILDTIHTLLLCIFLYHLTVTKYGQPESINVIHWSCDAVLLLNGVMSVAVQTFASYLQKYEWTIPMAASVLAFGDLLNTLAICFFLSMRKTGHRRTNRLITKVIRWTIETGLVTTICAVVTVILCVTMSTSLTWVGLFFFFPKIYSISMLVSLNSREKLRNDASKSREETLSSAMQLSLSRPQEGPAIEMVPMRSEDEWGMQKPVPSD